MPIRVMNGRTRPADRVTRAPYARLAWAFGELQRTGLLRVRDLRTRHEVSVRTAYRDLDFLRDSWNIPLDYDRVARAFRVAGRLPSVPSARLTEGEVVAIVFAERLCRQFAGTPFEVEARSAFRKVETLLPTELTVDASTLDAYLSLDLGPVHVPSPEIFKTLLRAVRERRVTAIRYRSLSSNTTRRRRIHPYRIFNSRGDWYLAAWDHRRSAVRDFALHRVLSATTESRSFDPDPHFDFDEYRKRAFGIEKADPASETRVRLRFAARQGRWIRERRWHPTARCVERADRSVELQMKVALTSELERWILQFGEEVEVLEPAELRSRIAARLRHASVGYSGRVQRREAIRRLPVGRGSDPTELNP